MSISSVSSVPAAAPSPLSASSHARAADGDYKAANVNSSRVKDTDGDYKPIAAASTAAARSSNAVQSSLSALKAGG